MLPTPSGSIRLLRVADIDVYLHWLWLPFAYLIIVMRRDLYESPVWSVAEYVTLFGIVLLHEFGHALACRSVGGKSDYIVLWPLGGVAYVAPPPRPAAVLWSIVAGPLVNLVLVPITLTLLFVGVLLGCKESAPDLFLFLVNVCAINVVLLVFNMLPIYPLDGGQIVQALLWFFIGRVRSLMVVTVVGLVVGAIVLVVMLVLRDFWLAIVAFFVASRSLAGFQQARMMLHMLSGPRHPEFACPACGEHPIAGDLWICDHCRQRFDTFAHRSICPNCNAVFNNTMCPFCFERHAIAEWSGQRSEVRSQGSEVRDQGSDVDGQKPSAIGDQEPAQHSHE